MNEDELLALLMGQRKSPIAVCRVPAHLVRLIGAHETLVRLSPETIAKQESKHKHRTVDLYALAPTVIQHGFVRVQPPKHLVFIYHTQPDEHGKRRSFKATVKATRHGHELYLVSLFQIDRTGVRATYKKTLTVEEWMRRCEVGPPSNPT